MMFVKYSRIVIGHPLPTICITLTISVILTIIGLYYGYETIDFDPTKGFETRGTELADGRIFMENLKGQQASNSRIIKWFYEQNQKTTNTKNKREVNNNEEDVDNSPNITVNYDDYGVDYNPNFEDLNDSCEFFGSFGIALPYDAIEYMSKIMIRFDSWDKKIGASKM
ncbi:unnamed protein product [Caenorhabditis angaria]|uniref:Uncharacterized protein n=1 Tax=Caenorhabditis angaria TaxID=860376 RepID=A0A9P1IUA7_9PELO|nr:unnamed protein product [Caenorhabditis angaria]